MEESDLNLESEMPALSQIDPSSAKEAQTSTTDFGSEAREFGRQELADLQKAHGVQFEGIEQLAASEKGQLVMQLWKAGAPLTNAWAAVNLDKIAAKSAVAAKQAAMNALLGKSHLVSTTATAAASAPVPTEVYEQYKELMPKMTDAQIRASWQRYRSR